MFDRIVRAGTVVDGSGAPPFTADVAVEGGEIVEVSRQPLRALAREVLDADGALVTPGFVDVHTHYDGQATWDDQLAPSCWHGVTSVVMGNCGVGFAPVEPGREQELIEQKLEAALRESRAKLKAGEKNAAADQAEPRT